MNRELLKGALAVVLAGAAGLLALVVFVSTVRRDVTAPRDRIAVRGCDGPLRVGTTTLEIELLDGFGEPLWLEDVRVRGDAVRVEGLVRRDENGGGTHTVPVTLRREGPSSLVIEQWWNPHSQRSSASVPIDVLPAK